MRRGDAPAVRGAVAGAAARARPGSIESRNGSAIAVPVPVRKWRRDTGRRAVKYGPRHTSRRGEEFIAARPRDAVGDSLVQKQVTLDQRVDQAADAVITRPRAF